MFAALVASVGLYFTLFIIWSIPGIIVIMSVMLVEWHDGSDLTLKQIIGNTLGGAILGWVVALFGIGYFFNALKILFNAAIGPFNFTIKGRKRK